MRPSVARQEQFRSAASTYYQKNKEVIRKKNKERQAKKRAFNKRVAAYDDTLPPSDAMTESSRSTPLNDSPSPPATLNLFIPGSDDYPDPTYVASMPNRGPSPVDTSSIDTIRRIRGAIQNWTSALGPVEDWPRIFREYYDEACLNTAATTTQAAIDIFLGKVGDHVRVGKKIIAELESCTAVDLSQPRSGTGDQLLAGDLMRTLHRGVAILEARLEIHAPSGAHTSALHSNIRRHEEFVT